MHYVYLFFAIVAEVAATSALKASEQFTRPWPSAVVIVGYSTSFFLLGLVLKTLPWRTPRGEPPHPGQTAGAAMNASDIRAHMEVHGSCGNRVGLVDRVEGGSIRLTRASFGSGGEHHYIPLSWVEAVGESIRL